MIKSVAISIILLFSLTSCSSKPKLLPNDLLINSSKEKVQQDIDDCLKLADEYVSDSSKFKEVALKTTKAGVLGAAGGAVAGAIVHNAGRGVAIGSASAVVVTLLSELISSGEPDPTYKNFANYCLSKKGYEIAGWQ